MTIDGSGDNVLSWDGSSDGTYDVSFLSSATLRNIIVSSLAPLAVSDGYKTGDNVSFSTSQGLVVGANSTATIGEGSYFDSSKAAAIMVEDGGCVVVKAGATFTKNTTDGGIFLEGGATSPAEERYNLVVKADTGKNTLFEDNGVDGELSDVYFGSGAAASVQADGSGVVSFKSAILSEDENAGIVKTGTGTLEVRDAPNYSGSLEVREGVVSVQVNWGDGGVTVYNGAEFHLDTPSEYAHADGTFVSGNVTLNSGAKLSVAADTKATISGAQVQARGGSFHLTGGLNFSGMKLDAKATIKNEAGLQGLSGEYDFGGTTYKVATGDEAQVKGRYEWNRVQPYLGIGWSSDGDGDRSFYFSCDIGVNFIGKGQLSVSHSGADIQVKGPDGQYHDVADIDAMLEASLREEGKDFFDIADKVIVYPVIQFGIVGCF